MKAYLKNIIDNDNSGLGRLFSLFIQALILISVITFSLETIPNLKPSTKFVLRVIETFSVIVFTVEYILRIYVAENKLKFIFSHVFWLGIALDVSVVWLGGGWRDRLGADVRAHAEHPRSLAESRDRRRGDLFARLFDRTKPVLVRLSRLSEVRPGMP